MASIKPSALTIKSNFGLAKVLACEIEIKGFGGSETIKVNGIWDTGATGSVITLNVINKLGLVSSSFTEVHTANGKVMKRIFDISIILSNRVTINGIVATEADALSGGCDALIGMDVISIGDFSITNYKGVTCMSFRTPSMHETDFVKNIYIDNTKIIRINPDAYCPCGSKYETGEPKKYKFCCGKN